MKNSIITLALLSLLGATACNKERRVVYYDDYSYDGYGTSTVENYQEADVSFTVEDNLNVHGMAVLTDNAVIGSDLNLNDEGKVRIAPHCDTCEIIVMGNTNINDTMFVDSGILRIKGNLNVNATGFVSCSPLAKIIIEHDLNQSGEFWGLNYTTAYNQTHLNDEIRSYYISYYERDSTRINYQY